jgi:energy-coupling factor transporter transmembrane protein EcfT
MQARGFRGEVFLVEDLAMTRVDWMAFAAFAAVAAVAIWAGR